MPNTIARADSVKQLGISRPKVQSPLSASPSGPKLHSNVIVVAKYNFVAELDSEISVAKGDVFKLLSRLTNGWILVQLIDKVQHTGLIPSLYVDIALNDPLNPITLDWLQGKSSQVQEAQVRSLLAENHPRTLNNRPYPLRIWVLNYLMFEDRFWYRVDVTFSTGQQNYLCRYYEDFYNLHADLLAESEAQHLSTPLPKLPPPIASVKRTKDEQRELFLERCKSLSAHMAELTRKPEFQASPLLLDWLEVLYKNLPGFSEPESVNLASDVISQRILPGSTTLASDARAIVKNSSKPMAPTQMPIVSRPIKAELKRSNTYNHYRQVAPFTTEKTLRSASISSHSPRVNTSLQVLGSSPPDGKSKSAGDPRTPRLGRYDPNLPETPEHPSVLPNGESTSPTSQSTSELKNHSTSSSRIHYTPKTQATPSQKSQETRSLSVEPTPNPQVQTTPNLKSQNGSSFDSFPPTPTSRHGSLELAKNPGRLLCKVKVLSGDVINLRVDKDFNSVEEFEQRVCEKVPFTTLFLRPPNANSYTELAEQDFDVFNFLKTYGEVDVLVM